MLSVPIERLLAHEGFLRALAARLVRDPAGAEDVVQATWVAALERPPREGVPPRGWLATVARNVARMGWRRDRRRERREHVAARAEAVLDPEGVRERERARQAVVDAVLRLDEPYRTVVLLRFYEGLEAGEAARRLGAPVETVRTQTRRAVERLRQDLDGRHPRAAWTALVLPLTASRAQASAQAAAQAGAVGWGGWILMGLKERATMLLLLCLVLAGSGTWMVLHDRRDTRPSEDALAPPVDASGPTPEAGTPPRGPELSGAASEPRAPGTPVRTDVDVNRHTRPRGRLRGVVYSGRTHRPVAGASVFAEMARGRVPGGLAVRVWPGEGDWFQETDEQGRFELPDAPLGAYTISVDHDEEGTARELALAAADPPWVQLYLMPDEPKDAGLRLRTVDAGGRVLPATVLRQRHGEHEVWERRSDALGLCVIPSAGAPRMGWLEAQAGDLVARVELGRFGPTAEASGGVHDLVLLAPGRIEGRVVAPAGADFGSATVEAWPWSRSSPGFVAGSQASAAVGSGGAFAFDVPAGTYLLLVRGVPRHRMADSAGSGPAAGVAVDVEAGASATARIALALSGAIHGRVTRPDGRPLAGCRVEVSLPRPDPREAGLRLHAGVQVWHMDDEASLRLGSPLGARHVTTDADGAYLVDGLEPGDHRVRVVPDVEDLSFHLVVPVGVRDGDTVKLEHRLEAAGTLELTAPPLTMLGLRRAGQSELHAVFVTPAGTLGAVTIPGLTVGVWEVSCVHPDPAVAPVRLAGFELRPREITYVDVMEAGATRVRVRLLQGGRPVVGAQVHTPTHGWSMLVSDAEGRVTWATTTFDPLPHVDVRVEAAADALALAVRVPLGEGESTVVLPSGSLAVRVRDDEGRTVRNARVTLAPERTAGGSPTPAGESERGTDADGCVLWRAVPAGAYLLQARLPGRAGRVSEAVTVGEGRLEVELVAPRSGSMRLRVRRADGAPAADVPVSLQHLPAVRALDGWDKAVHLTENGWRTDAAGEIVLSGIPPGRVRAGAWVLPPGALTVTENGVGEADVRPGEETLVELRLAAVGR